MDLYRCYSGAAAKLHFFFVTARGLWKFYEAIPAIAFIFARSSQRIPALSGLKKNPFQKNETDFN